jgi:hypothetical protein
MAHQSVLKIKEKSFSPSADYHIGMNRLVAELTVKPGRRISLEPFIDEQGHPGIRIIAEKV